MHHLLWLSLPLGESHLIDCCTTWNAFSPMVVTPSGRVTLIRLLPPKECTISYGGHSLWEKVTLVRLQHPLECTLFMVVTPSGEVTLVRLLAQAKNVFPPAGCHSFWRYLLGCCTTECIISYGCHSLWGKSHIRLLHPQNA